jgi:F0F1-type ATP synthase membrane subunit b/b'
VVAEARKEAQATIAEAKASTQEEQNKKLAEVKAVSAPRHAHPLQRRLQ